MERTQVDKLLLHFNTCSHFSSAVFLIPKQLQKQDSTFSPDLEDKFSHGFQYVPTIYIYIYIYM